MDEADGQLHTLSVLEQLREASKGLWGASSAAEWMNCFGN
jgi:hypothetical protein